MNEEQARAILQGIFKANNALYQIGGDFYLSWAPGSKFIVIDGEPTLLQLEAIAWWVRNKGGGVECPT